MTTYNTGFPQANDVAIPPVANKPTEFGGRVRIMYGKIVIPASSVPGTTDLVNIGKLPIGAKIIGKKFKWGDMNDSTHTFTIKAGTTAISAALNVGTAQAAYAPDYTGDGTEVTSEALRQISATLGGAAMNGTAANKFEMLLEYVID